MTDRGLADVFAEFVDARDRGLEAAIRSHLARKRTEHEVDVQAVKRAIEGSEDPADVDQLRRFAAATVANEREATADNIFQRRGRSDERAQQRAELAGWVRGEVSKLMARSDLSVKRSLEIIAERLQDEPAMAPAPLTPTYNALQQLYYKG